MNTSSLHYFEALKELLRAPSVSADSSYKKGILQAQAILQNVLEGMGMAVEVVELPTHAALLAKKVGNPNAPHVVIYGHYDVQPVDPIALWESDPFEPRIQDGKLYARGAADNKGPLMAVLGGVARFLKSKDSKELNITILIEGEEEIGSPSFLQFLEQNKESVSGDFILIVDGMIPAIDCPAILIGCRGVTSLEVKLKGPAYDLHSGQHGGAVRNPIQALVELLSTLHTPEGRINIPGYYEDVVLPADWERQELKRWPQTIEAYKADLSVKDLHVIPGYTPFEAINFLPTLEFNGITGGYQAEGSKTVIPSVASVKISLRLVPNQTAEKCVALLTKTLQERLPSGVEMEITYGSSGDPYYVSPPQDPNCPSNQNLILKKAFAVAHRLSEITFTNPPIYMRSGGTLPLLNTLKQVTGMDAILLGFSTPDSRIHSPNENVSLELLEKGEGMICQFLQDLQ